MMLSRSGFGRNAALTLRKQCVTQSNTGRRGMAAAASKSFEYETGETGGVKIATRDVPGPTTTLSVIAKAGSRYQPAPGFADALAKFAFKSTNKRSALRITRESELLGGDLAAYNSRENLVLTARFLTSDLPYYAELLAEVVTNSKYSRHELQEVIVPQLKLEQGSYASNPTAQALDSAHNVAFHRGLGEALVPSASSPSKEYLDSEGLASFAQGVYAKPSIAVVASGANSTEDVSKWVGQFFTDAPTTNASGPFAPVAPQATQYFGGETRIDNPSGNAVVIAFQGSSAFGTAGHKPAFSVLASLLGGESPIKWSPGSSVLSQATQSTPGVHVSTNQATYTDAGLLYVTITGKGAGSVSEASKNVAQAIQKVAAGQVSSEDIKKAIAQAKFRALESGQSLTTGVELTGSALVNGGKPFQIAELGQSIEKVTEQQVKEAAKSLVSKKASYAAVGDLSTLPFATELGLTV